MLFRSKDGKLETKPALKVFKPNGTGDLEIVVADYDPEGKPGYGVPDLVEEMGKIESSRDIKDNSELMSLIFKQEQKPQRQYPEGEEINKLYIVKSGTAPLESYENRQEGWEEFLPEYRSISAALFQTVQMKGKSKPKITVQVKTDYPTEDQEEDEEQSEFAKIAWIALWYEGDARVMEFYHPNEQFREKKYRITAQGREVTVRDEEGQIKQYDVKALLEKKPYRIDFDRNQEKRWEILDKDKDNIHYEAKWEIARPDTIEWEK